MIKVIVAGSRDFKDFELLKSKLDFYLKRYSPSQVEIVSGAARGADRMGERYALARQFKLNSFPAQWDVYGKSAGYLRNEVMAKYSTHCVVFIVNNSKGSSHMIELAKKHKLNLRVVRISFTIHNSQFKIIKLFIWPFEFGLLTLSFSLE